jgi:hypothetical protein
VGTHAQKLGDALEGTRGIEDGGAPDGVIPSCVEICQQESRAVDADEVRDGQTRITKFGAELMRPVGVPGPRRRSQGRQPAGPFDVRGELGKLRMIQIQPITQIEDPRYPARDRGHEYRAARPYDSARFGERMYPVSALTEMVKGTEQEHRID